MLPSRVCCGCGLKPVRSFVALSPFHSEGPFGCQPNKRRASTTLPKHRSMRPHGATDFYSSATPRVQLLKHPLTSGHRGTTPAATLLPGLVMVYVSRHPYEGSLRSVTLLGDLIPN